MDLKTFLTLAAAQALLLVLQGLLYVGVQYFQGPYHDMARPLDRKIPLVPQAVYVYILWYPLIALYPIYLYSCSALHYGIYIFAILLDIGISTFIYWKYPTSFERPPVPEKGLSGFILKLIRIGNYKGLNCMPSMHCSMCFIIILSVLSCSAMDNVVGAGICILACSILISTLLTKQHVVNDLTAALPLAFICYVVSSFVLC